LQCSYTYQKIFSDAVVAAAIVSDVEKAVEGHSDVGQILHHLLQLVNSFLKIICIHNS
jgi:hypothetical protein